jgi:hypothetical protein
MVADLIHREALGEKTGGTDVPQAVRPIVFQKHAQTSQAMTHEVRERTSTEGL